ncbi:MAG: hypothetical protein HOQ11_05365 [Gemmatimonadaceae bacterium]|nr:hypothetical protein [Gemmatimonadaceae bacterium]NUQ93839.1 hypothetical protein [Gemmatimonadaceae bacterium]NUR19047.1 hypothetical protein [Gemmatimonadaceae bacterium]NUS96818.1 hypothetical protein [Gemmatimonadaceae bacterium]
MHLAAFISGLLAAGYLTIGLFFARFYKRTRDRLFLLFAIAFWVLVVQRVATVLTAEWIENVTWLYGMRLLAFVIILVAILDKNRASDG